MVSVIVLCRNEVAHVGKCLDSLLANSYPASQREIIIVDGMSDDGTREVLQRYAGEHQGVRLVDNPKQITPAAFNIGIANALGDIVMPVGAHAIYPTHYIATLLAYLESTGADNVGGLCDTVPANGSPKAAAIADAMSHRLGVGSAMFRVGVSQPTWVDTVPFGCYRREVFDRIGRFDEELVRNQDDEFNHRLRRAGGRILLIPDVTIKYVARDNIRKLARTFYQYGYYKPLAVRKLGHVPTIRQLVPPTFVATLIATTAMGASSTSLLGVIPLGLLLGAYAALLFVALLSQSRKRGVRSGCWMPFAIATIHLSYGTGWLRGFASFVLLNRRRSDVRHHGTNR